MRIFNKISSIILALCMAVSLFAVPTYATTDVDVKDAISLSGTITDLEDELDVNLTIPAGISGIRGVQFKIVMPEGFTINSVESAIDGWGVDFGTKDVVVLNSENYQTIEEIFGTKDSYKIATLNVVTDLAEAGENGAKTAEITVIDITSANGNDNKPNTNSTSVNKEFQFSYCAHKYEDGPCDTICDNGCGTTRVSTVAHTHANCEDTVCSVCSQTIEAKTHQRVYCDDTTCKICNATIEAQSHTGGTATCVKEKECTICGKAYGGVDLNNHNYSSDCDTTCDNEGCTAAPRVTAVSHSRNYCDDTTCKVCGDAIAALGHTGGTANCKDKAKCTVCGKAYGEINKNNHKSAINYNAVAATCTNEGSTAGFKCNACGVDTRKVVNKKAHSYGANYVSKAATEKATGTISKKCACGDVAYVSTIAKITSIKLSKTTYTYTGKSLKPSVTVKDSKGNKLVKDTDYTVKYSNNKKVGKATVKVTFKGKYSGTKTLTFKINPKATKISSLKAGKKAFTVKYSKQTSGSGYEIQYSTSSKFKSAKTVKITKNKTVSKTVKKLKAKKTYYVRVRVVKGSYKSAWSASKKVKTK